MPPEDNDRPSEVREKPTESKSDSGVADLARTGQEIPQELKNAFQERAESRMKGLTASSRCLPGLDFSSDALGKPDGTIDVGRIPPVRMPDLELPTVPDAVTLPRDIDPGFVPEPGWKTGADVNFPAGTNVRIEPDGTTFYDLPDGGSQERLTNGTIINKGPYGGMEIRRADGTIISDDMDGNWTTRSPDGSTLIERPDGTKVTETPDGTVTTERPDGTTITETPDGHISWTQIPPDLLPLETPPDVAGDVPQIPGGEIPADVPPPGGELPGDQFPGFPGGEIPGDVPPPGGEFPGDQFPGGGGPGDELPPLPGGEFPGGGGPDDLDPGFTPGGKGGELPSDLDPRFTPGREVPEEPRIITNPDGTIDISSIPPVRMPDGTPAWKRGEGPVDGAATTTIEPDGTTVYEMPDGARHERRPDGTIINHNPDGSGEIRYRDGTVDSRDVEGNRTTTKPDGAVVQDGKIHIEPDGTTITEMPDGARHERRPDGTIINRNPDGSGEIRYRDGTVDSRDVEGNWTTTKPDGTVVQDGKIDIRSDGTVVQERPDGTNVSEVGGELPADLVPGFIPGGKGGDGPIDFDPGFIPGRDLPADEPIRILPEKGGDIADTLDAEAFKKAVNGGRKDAAAFLKMLEDRNPDEIRQLQDVYKDKYGIALKFELAAVLKGADLERALTALDSPARGAESIVELAKSSEEERKRAVEFAEHAGVMGDSGGSEGKSAENTGWNDYPVDFEQKRTDDGIRYQVAVTREKDGHSTEIAVDKNGKFTEGRRYDEHHHVVEKVSVVGDKLVYEDVNTHAKRVEQFEIDGVHLKTKDLTHDYNADEGTMTSGWLGNWRFERSFAPGRSDTVFPDGSISGTTTTGEVSQMNKQTGETSVVQYDGTGVWLHADGTIDLVDPKAKESERHVRDKLSSEEQKYLKEHPDIDTRDVAELHRRFHNQPEKIDEFYKQLEAVDSANNLNPEQKIALRRDLIHHVAEPAEIYQGTTESCNVSAIERDVAMTDPAKYASTVVEAVSKGTIDAHGEKVPVDVNNLTMADASGRDLASRVFQTAVLHAEFYPTKDFRNTPDGQGRLYPGDAQHNQGAEHWVPFTGLMPAELAEVRYKLDDKHEKVVQQISDEKGLREALEKNGVPMTIGVDGASEPFSKGTSSGRLPNHVVTIVGIIEGNPRQYLVQNQWGLDSDHSTPPKAKPISEDELINNMQRQGMALVPGDHTVTLGNDGKPVRDEKGAVIKSLELQKQSRYT